VLEDLTALRFAEPETKAQVERALKGLAQNRAKDRRTLSISLLGKNKRQAGFSYVVAAPVWKSAYRLVLPKENGKARLQGWGIVENLTGNDWKDVDLTLISGNPVALKQKLYTAFYADRPEIPVSVASRFVPEQDKRGRRLLSQLEARNKAPSAMLKAAPAAEMEASRSADGYGGAPAHAAVATESEEAATQVLYHFPTKITLSSGSTMMVPYVDHEFAAKRVWLYQPNTNPKQPFAAIRLKNDSDSSLPAGLITAFEHSSDNINFVGDAQMPMLPKSASKFITFALDNKTDIRRTDQGVKQTRLGKAINGQLNLTIKSRWNIDYEIMPPEDEDREVVIDETRHHSWKLANDMKDVEETASRLRYTVKAAKGVTSKARLKLERMDHQTVMLSTMEPEVLYATINGLENESSALKTAVAKLGAIVEEINKIKARQKELQSEYKEISTDQDRLRQNLHTVGKNTDLGQHYLKTMKDQETRLITIHDLSKKLKDDIKEKQKEAKKISIELVLE
jgi:hypothetical protein